MDAVASKIRDIQCEGKLIKLFFQLDKSFTEYNSELKQQFINNFHRKIFIYCSANNCRMINLQTMSK